MTHVFRDISSRSACIQCLLFSWKKSPEKHYACNPVKCYVNCCDSFKEYIHKTCTKITKHNNGLMNKMLFAHMSSHSTYMKKRFIRMNYLFHCRQVCCEWQFFLISFITVLTT